MDLEAIVGQLDSDQTQDLFGICAQNLDVDQIFRTLKYYLSKSDMVELGERFVDEGSAA